MGIPAGSRQVSLALLLAGGMVFVACQASPTTSLPTEEPSGVNVVREAGLAGATTLEILEHIDEAGTEYRSRATITDQAVVAAVVKELDRVLPLGPRARCTGKYRLRFITPVASQEFDYFCQDGTSFLRGGQPFWREMQVQPPHEFDALLARLLAGL